MDTAAEMGFQCLEVACWPAGKAERRYAGVSHIDAERVGQHAAVRQLFGIELDVLEVDAEDACS